MYACVSATDEVEPASAHATGIVTGIAGAARNFPLPHDV